MKVLHLISSGGMYGAEAVVLTLAQGLAHCHHDVVLGIFANSAGGDVQLYHEGRAHGIESLLLPCHGQFDRKLFAQLRGLVRDRGFDIVHAHGYKADVYAYLALRSTGVVLVSTCHNWLDSNAKVRAYGIADRFALRSFAAVAAVSDAVCTTLIRSGVARAKVRLIPNGIDPEPFANAADPGREANPSGGPLRVGLIGRLTHEKGIDLFLRSAALVLAEQPEVQFVIAGDGPDRSLLGDLAQALGIQKQVTFLGRCEHIPELLASLDIVVCASRREGLPISVLEAMASRRPVIATTVGEIPMVLDHGDAGVLVAPEDATRLADAITSLVLQPGRCQSLADAGHRRVLANFSASRMTHTYLDFYSDAMSPGR